METLLNLRKEYGSLTVIFKGRVMVVCSMKPLISVKFTNFFKDTAVDPRDTEATAQILTKLATLGNEASFRMD
ncbi:hypothetical protein BH11PAT4_BH11PAT4_3520 [soil metagenome]